MPFINGINIDAPRDKYEYEVHYRRMSEERIISDVFAFKHPVQLGDCVVEIAGQTMYEFESDYGNGYLVLRPENFIAFRFRAKSKHIDGPSTLEQIEEHLRNGKTISAIKVLRNNTGLGLKESKDWVMDYWPVFDPESYNATHGGRK